MRVALVLAVAALAPAAAGAQDLAGRVAAAAGDGRVHFSFDARADVCGDGESIWTRGEDGTTSWMRNARSAAGRVAEQRSLEDRCENGPVRFTLERAGGRFVEADVEVGGPVPADARDLGSVSAAAAVDYLLDTVAPRAEHDAAHAAIFAATLTDIEVWPRLLEIARDERIANDVRKAATFFVGSTGADRATRSLAEMVGDDREDLDVRRAALFSLSQRKDESTFRILLETARSHRHVDLRRTALFLLGQSGDPRALALFEQILLKR